MLGIAAGDPPGHRDDESRPLRRPRRGRRLRALPAARSGAMGAVPLGRLLGPDARRAARPTGALNGIAERQDAADTTKGAERSTRRRSCGRWRHRSSATAPPTSFTSEITVGTQGMIWDAMFCFGFVGLALFAFFLLGGLARTGRRRTLSRSGCTPRSCRPARSASSTGSTGTSSRSASSSGSCSGSATPRRSPLWNANPRTGSHPCGLNDWPGAGSYSDRFESSRALAALVLAVLIGNGLGAHGTGVFFQAVGFFTIVSQILRLGTNSSIVRTISEQHAFGAHRGELAHRRDRRRPGRGPLRSSPSDLRVRGAVGSRVARAAGREPRARGVSFGTSRRYVVPPPSSPCSSSATRMMRGIVAYTLVADDPAPLSARALLVALARVGRRRARRRPRVAGGAPAVADRHRRGAGAPLHPATGVRAGRRLEPRRRRSRRFWAFSGTRAVGGSLETCWSGRMC